MNLNLSCIVCNLKQVLTVTDLIKVNDATREIIMREVLAYLQATSYERSNPEVIKGTWDIITKHIGDNNPYREIKRYYNNEILKIADRIRVLVNNSDDPFNKALKIAITANLIDFAASHEFDEQLLLKKIDDVDAIHMPVDDSKSLHDKLKTAKTLLYLGDNCGEIVLDKVFIETIRKMCPDVKVYFGVRGEPIVNDVTSDDADLVGMQEVADVISNGDGSLGTVIERTAPGFKEIFSSADVIIAKGQGNYESLSESSRHNIFFLFMAKCDAVANLLNVPNLSIVCAEN